ncbi:alpha/beta hydrolase family protein [Fulvivirga ligni]|uniref:alpha/beta hydrolase family protein n=1 Tax=Fulvivirga ligni TaxID=2904246 RepID=UPI001F22A9E0|nr:lipase family protein [Fulvivirga ligni]UII22814.1 CocE/NonD family hydrolase [Fulvivirga ligni]
MRSFTFLMSIIFLSLVACGSDDDPGNDPVEPEFSYFSEAEEVNDLSVAQIEGLLQIGSIAEPDIIELKPFIEYDVKTYRIIYNTTFLGESIQASGLIALPQTSNSLPIMSFQNGTYVEYSQAPSKNTDVSTIAGALASAGYILAIPDYIGFGESEGLPIPYHSEEYTARAVIDLVKAAQEFASLHDVEPNGKVFLAGYSEGGYATMAAHKRMESENPEGLELMASAPASGGYDVKGFQEYLFNQETYSTPFYLAYVALSYQQIYDFQEPLSYLFQEPYATNIPSLFNGVNSGGAINNQLTVNMSDLLQAEIIAGIDSDEKYAYFVDALIANTIIDWVPKAQMFMYHGDADITVPYQNSVTTYNHLIDAGADEDRVEFITLEGKTHGTGFYPYLSDMIEKFDALR